MGCQGSVIVFRVTLVTRVRAPAMPIRQLAADVRAHEQAELARLEGGGPVDSAGAGSSVQPVASQQTVAEQETAGLVDENAGAALSTGCEQQEARAALVTGFLRSIGRR